MLYRPQKLSQKHAQEETLENQVQDTRIQDGLHDDDDSSPLLDIPVEILTRITSFMDPYTLFALSLVRKSLFKHVEDDNTWKHAFMAQYLGIGPEGDIQDSSKHVLLTRSFSCWKREFIVRDDLIRRWARSPVGTVSHSPLHSQIFDMRLLEGDGLLCSSLQYGVVSRSFPLTGSILPGYLDAAGSTNGRGIGNPNAEFTPNVSTCVMAADGGTVRILWGYRDGLVAFMTTIKTMETSPRLADFKTCDLGDTHDLAVVDALWMSGPSGWLAVTAGQDGRVKLWDPLTGICIWSSEPILPPAVPEPCTRVVANYNAGVIAVTYRSGAIRVWSGFHFKITERTNIFPTCSTTVSPLFTPTEENETIDVLAFQIDANPTTPTLVVAFDGDHFFHRIDFIDKLESHTVTSFGEGTLGTLSAVTPCMSSDFAASRLVVTGDRLGCVGVYLWDSEPSCSPVPPVHKFEAFRDGSTITSIAWNGVTLVTGSARGITHIFDGLSLEPLKVLSLPAPPFPRGGPVPTSPGPDMRAVHHILLGPNKDVIFVGVGDRVLAWKPGPVARYLRGGMRTRAVPRKSPKKVQSGSAKWSRQFEMKHHIVESKCIMDEEDRHQSHIRSYLDQQRAQLRKMGLSEDEVVQYILMMSRDEDTPTPPTPQATASTRPSINGLDGLTDEELAAALEEGMFELDYDRPITASGLVSVPSSSSSSAHTPVPVSPSRAPALRPSSSNSKVQVSPRYVPEPMQAGIDGSPPSSPTPRRPIPLGQAEHFPVVGSGTVSPASSVSGGSATSSRRNSNAFAYSETQRRPFKSAWNAPLRVSSSSTSAASPSTSPVANVIGRSPPTPSSSRIVANPVQQTNSFDDMDDDLRFALELSLAEARSRGENA